MKPEAKQRFILPSLMLCLLHEWTLGRNPKKDLEELGIDKELAIETITDLIQRGFAHGAVESHDRKLSLYLILDNHLNFREALVLTPRGVVEMRECNLKKLSKAWKNFGKRT